MIQSLHLTKNPEAKFMDETKQGFQELTAKGLAVIGVVAVLLVGMWLAVAAVRLAPTAVSSLAAAFVSMTSVFVPSERVEISLPQNLLTEDTPVTLSWNHINKKVDGSYVFSYFCAPGLYFTARATSDSAEEKVFCNTPFNFVSKDNTLVLTPHLEGVGQANATLVISFTRNGETSTTLATERMVSVSAETTTAVVPSTNTQSSTGTNTNTSNPAVTTPSTPQTNVYQFTGTSTPVSNPNGTMDLRGKVIAVGIVDRTTGDFTASTSVTVSDRAAIRFEVENIGTKTTTPWSFNAVLPTLPFHVFQSGQQIPLAPGDKIEFTLGFDNIENQRTVNLTVNIDPTNQVYDIDRSNNTLRQTITVYDK